LFTVTDLGFQSDSADRGESSRAVRWLALVVVLGASSVVFPAVFLGAAFVLLGLAAARFPRAALLGAGVATFALRPLLDIFSERRLGLGPLSTDPAVFLGIGVLTVALVVGARRVASGQRLFPDATALRAHVWLFVAYGLMVFSGWRLFGIAGLGEGIREAVRITSIVAAFLALWWWKETDPRFYSRGWTFLALGTTGAIAVAVWQLVTGAGFYEPDGLHRIQGTFSHPNSFGQYLAPLVLVAVSAVLMMRGAARLAAIAVAVTLAALLVLTFARTAILVLVVGLVGLLVAHARGSGTRTMASMILAGIVLGIVVWSGFGEAIRARFEGVSVGGGAWQDALVGQSENSFQWRLINWSGLVLLGLQHPLLGHGAGMTTQLNPLVNSDNGIPFNAHNDFVRFFFEGGVVGLLLYIAYGFVLCRWMFRLAREGSAARRGAALAVAVAFASMFFLTAGTTELSLHTANQYELYGLLVLCTDVGSGTSAPLAAVGRPASGLPSP
jgi:O-antigen ligase